MSLLHIVLRDAVIHHAYSGAREKREKEKGRSFSETNSSS